MPLNEPALALDPDPRSVQEARRWVGSVCRRLGRQDLQECAELGISELVTNALLHADAPISVRLRGTREHPRVEVSDGTAQIPVLTRHGADGDDLDELMATVGRGLDIVAMCAVAWGVTVETSGKCVWFEPAQVPHADMGPEALLPSDEELDPPDDVADDGRVRIVMHGLPISHLTDFRRHYQELRRELRLLSLAHQDDYPLASDLTEVFQRFEASFPLSLRTQYLDAVDRGLPAFDLETSLDPAAALVIEQMLELLDLADEFCRAKRLLALARTPAQREFQQWYFGEFVRQARGEAPTAWPPSRPGAQHVS
ncbi:ATP-binding protein [Nocardioides bigeumensis]|uniref:Histidine kinase/HSP90-like ATPase domain-containing protein n=1 Tax=Nocardioides bigeumensis TaxID=433657 RepID=A0ABP5K4F5_9ACTN